MQRGEQGNIREAGNERRQNKKRKGTRIEREKKREKWNTDREERKRIKRTQREMQFHGFLAASRSDHQHLLPSLTRLAQSDGPTSDLQFESPV